MEKNVEILLKSGIGDVKFDAPIDEVVKLWGEADEVEDLTMDDDMRTIVLHYDKRGVTLFFEEENPMLACIEINNSDAKLFEKKVFDLSEKEITSLMVENGFPEEDIEAEAWGEKRISFEKASIDFFFEKEELVSVVFAK